MEWDLGHEEAVFNLRKSGFNAGGGSRRVDPEVGMRVQPTVT